MPCRECDFNSCRTANASIENSSLPSHTNIRVPVALNPLAIAAIDCRVEASPVAAALVASVAIVGGLSVIFLPTIKCVVFVFVCWFLAFFLAMPLFTSLHSTHSTHSTHSICGIVDFLQMMDTLSIVIVLCNVVVVVAMYVTRIFFLVMPIYDFG